MRIESQADVCLVLEGTYPYVSGGVSMWTHHLIQAQSHLTFRLVCLVPERAELTLRYELPRNVISTTNIRVGSLPAGDRQPGGRKLRGSKALCERLQGPLLQLQAGGGLPEVAAIFGELLRFGPRLGRR